MWANVLQYLILGPMSDIWNTVMGLVSLSHAWRRVINLWMGLKITCNLRAEWSKPLLTILFGGRQQYYTYKFVQESSWGVLGVVFCLFVLLFLGFF